jgi:PEP-CTERM motif
LKYQNGIKIALSPSKEDPRMAYTLSIAVTVLMGLSGSAFAGAPFPVPEPTTLALLAVGFGGVAAVKYFKRK